MHNAPTVDEDDEWGRPYTSLILLMQFLLSIYYIIMRVLVIGHGIVDRLFLLLITIIVYCLVI